MEDQYGLADLSQYIDGGRSLIPPPVFPSAHRSLATDHNHPHHMFNFSSDNSTTIAPPAPGVTINTGGGLSGFVAEGGGGAGRWPRQETLTLLEIRAKLDPKFKEANQKGPLWDEISRIMSEEYGYHRSGKKCREKFENLYKYYKKTKVGKAGRQDGKHYRFFRQLEALYCDQTNNDINNNNSSASFSDQTHNFVVSSNLYNIPKYTNTNILANNNNNNNNNNQESYSSLISISNSSNFDKLISSGDDSELNTNTFDADDPKRKKKAWKKVLKAKIQETIDSQMKKMMAKQEAWMEKMMSVIEENERERISREERRRRQDDERVEREQKMWAGEKAWIEARDAAVMDAFGKLITGKETSVFDSELVTRDDKMCKEDWECESDYLVKKRKESSRMVGGDMYDESSIGNDSCLRYFNGVDGYGRIIN